MYPGHEQWGSRDAVDRRGPDRCGSHTPPHLKDCVPHILKQAPSSEDGHDQQPRSAEYRCRTSLAAANPHGDCFRRCASSHALRQSAHEGPSRPLSPLRHSLCVPKASSLQAGTTSAEGLLYHDLVRNHVSEPATFRGLPRCRGTGLATWVASTSSLTTDASLDGPLSSMSTSASRTEGGPSSRAAALEYTEGGPEHQASLQVTAAPWSSLDNAAPAPFENDGAEEALNPFAGGAGSDGTGSSSPCKPRGVRFEDALSADASAGVLPVQSAAQQDMVTVELPAATSGVLTASASLPCLTSVKAPSHAYRVIRMHPSGSSRVSDGPDMLETVAGEVAPPHGPERGDSLTTTQRHSQPSRDGHLTRLRLATPRRAASMSASPLGQRATKVPRDAPRDPAPPRGS